jgi:hypothetical protein
MAARHVLSVMPPVQNVQPRVFRAIELRANWLEIEVSEVDGISNEIEFLLPFTLFKTVHYICAEKSYICAHNTITFAFILETSISSQFARSSIARNTLGCTFCTGGITERTCLAAILN